jgi:branched-chain amino acid aminotransferase
MIWFGNRDGGSLIGNEVNAINPADRGYTVGQGVFETLPVRSGQPFALERHLDRLVRSAQILRLPEPNLNVVRDAVHRVIAANLGAIGELGRLRITYTAGLPEQVPTLMATCVAQTPWPDSTTAVTVPWIRNERSAINGAKSTSYAENVLALAAAHESGAAEAIFANTAGNLCEGAASNIFVVLDGELLTPTLASGCLPGVTRELVIQWFKIQEVELPMSVLNDAEEIFLTSSTRGIHPVVRIDNRHLEIGAVTRKLREQFQALVAQGINP